MTGKERKGNEHKDNNRNTMHWQEGWKHGRMVVVVREIELTQKGGY
jgi:hypothetical protein